MRTYVLSDLRDSFSDITRPLGPFSLDELEKAPHLHAWISDKRAKIAGRKIFREQTLQDTNEYLDFMRRFNNDTVFRLTVTKQYYLLSQLFEDPINKGKWLALLEEIQEEDDEHKRQLRDLWTLHVLSKLQPERVVQRDVELIKSDPNWPQFSWSEPSPMASDMEQLVHYEQELSRITYNYHRARIGIHIRTYQTHLNYLNSVKDRLRREGPEEHRELIRYLEEHSVRLEKRVQEMAPEPDNINDVKSYEEEWGAIAGDVIDVVSDYRGRPDAQSSTLNEMHRHNKAIFQHHNDELNQCVVAFEKQEKLLMAKIGAKKLSLVTNDLGRIESAIIQCQQSKEGLILPESDGLSLKQAVAELEQLKLALRHAVDSSELTNIELNIDRKIEIVSRILLAQKRPSQLNTDNSMVEGVSDIFDISQIVPENRKVEPSAPDLPPGSTSEQSVASAPEMPLPSAPELPTTSTFEQPLASAPEMPLPSAPELPTASTFEQPLASAPDMPSPSAPELPPASTFEQPLASAPEMPSPSAPELPQASTFEQPLASEPEMPLPSAPELPPASTFEQPLASAPEMPLPSAPDLQPGERFQQEGEGSFNRIAFNASTVSEETIINSKTSLHQMKAEMHLLRGASPLVLFIKDATKTVAGNLKMTTLTQQEQALLINAEKILVSCKDEPNCSRSILLSLNEIFAELIGSNIDFMALNQRLDEIIDSQESQLLFK